MGHECEKCIYVANRGNIVIPLEIVKKESSEPVFINFFTMPGWVGHAAFYAFVCEHCACMTVDYPHGYTGPGYLFLTCQNCDANFVLNSSKYTEIYRKDGMEPPPSIKKQARFLAWLWK